MEKAILKLTELYANEVKNSFAHVNELRDAQSKISTYSQAHADSSSKLIGMNELMKKRDERIKVLEGQLADYLSGSDPLELRPAVLAEQADVIDKLNTLIENKDLIVKDKCEHIEELNAEIDQLEHKVHSAKSNDKETQCIFMNLRSVYQNFDAKEAPTTNDFDVLHTSLHELLR